MALRSNIYSPTEAEGCNASEGVRQKRRGAKPPTSLRDRTSPPKIKTNKRNLKNCQRPRDGLKGLLRSRPTKDTERKETTQLKQDRHLHQPHRRRGSQTTLLRSLIRHKGGRGDVKKEFHWTVCVWQGKPGTSLRMGSVKVHPEDVDTQVQLKDRLRKLRPRQLFNK